MGGIGLRATGGAALAPALSLLTALTSLDLSANYFGDAGAQALAPALSSLSRLACLQLGRNGIGEAGAAALAAPLRYLTALSSLGLNPYNHFGENGVRLLIPALAHLPSLKHLVLFYERESDLMMARLLPELRAALPPSVFAAAIEHVSTYPFR